MPPRRAGRLRRRFLNSGRSPQRGSAEKVTTAVALAQLAASRQQGIGRRANGLFFGLPEQVQGQALGRARPRSRKIASNCRSRASGAG